MNRRSKTIYVTASIGTYLVVVFIWLYATDIHAKRSNYLSKLEFGTSAAQIESDLQNLRGEMSEKSRYHHIATFSRPHMNIAVELIFNNETHLSRVIVHAADGSYERPTGTPDVPSVPLQPKKAGVSLFVLLQFAPQLVALATLQYQSESGPAVRRVCELLTVVMVSALMAWKLGVT